MIFLLNRQQLALKFYCNKMLEQNFEHYCVCSTIFCCALKCYLMFLNSWKLENTACSAWNGGRSKSFVLLVSMSVLCFWRSAAKLLELNQSISYWIELLTFQFLCILVGKWGMELKKLHSSPKYLSDHGGCEC